MVGALTRTPLQDGYVSYPWEKRMNELLAVPKSSSFYSLLLLPKASDKVSIHYNDLEDTLSRANAWLIASQASGVPIVFMNIQTESLLTKVPKYSYLSFHSQKLSLNFSRWNLCSHNFNFTYCYFQPQLNIIQTPNPPTF